LHINVLLSGILRQRDSVYVCTLRLHTVLLTQLLKQIIQIGQLLAILQTI